MQQDGQSTLPDGRCDEFNEKRALVQIDLILSSELPYRVSVKRTGVVLGSFETRGRVDEFIDRVSMTTLKPVKITRKGSGR